MATMGSLHLRSLRPMTPLRQHPSCGCGTLADDRNPHAQGEHLHPRALETEQSHRRRLPPGLFFYPLQEAADKTWTSGQTSARIEVKNAGRNGSLHSLVVVALANSQDRKPKAFKTQTARPYCWFRNFPDLVLNQTNSGSKGF